MKGHKLLALLLALLLCVQLLPVSTAFAAEVSEDGVSVTLKANDVEYGTVTSGSKLTGLGNGDELTDCHAESGQQCKVQQVGRIQRRRRNCVGNRRNGLQADRGCIRLWEAQL